jgi:hypothetical protein
MSLIHYEALGLSDRSLREQSVLALRLQIGSQSTVPNWSATAHLQFASVRVYPVERSYTGNGPFFLEKNP